MALLKKLRDDWVPSENKSLQVGEVFDFPGPFIDLVKNGSALLVDEQGNELPLPGTIFTCAICFAESNTLETYTAHVLGHAAPKTTVEPITAPTPEVKAEVDDIKAKRLANIAKAQAAAKAKREAAKAAQE